MQRQVSRRFMTEIVIFSRGAKLRGQMCNFKDNHSAKDIISRHISKMERVFYLTTLPA